jgi:hypothetical protein
LRNDPQKPLQGNEERFDNFFKKMFFPNWTRPDHLEKGVRQTKIAEDRQWLTQLLERAKNPAAHLRLRELIRDVMVILVKQDPRPERNYHPAVRYNAMLLIGELNSTEAITGVGKAPAVPWEEVLDVLRENVTDPTQIDGVRVAALIGIQRHAEGDLAPDPRSQIIADLLPILRSDPPAGRSPRGHEWIQRQVMEILGSLGETGPRNVVVAELRKFLIDENKLLSLRCSAAAALGQLRYSGRLPLSWQQLAGEMGAVAAKACQDELKWLKQRIADRQAQLVTTEPDLVSEMLGAGSGGSGEIVDVGDPVLHRCDQLARRRLKSRMIAISTGLSAVDRLEPSGPAGVRIDRLIEAVDGVKRALEEVGVPPEDLPQRIDETSKNLEEQVNKVLGGEKPPTPAGPAAAKTPGPGDTPPPAEKSDVPDVPF